MDMKKVLFATLLAVSASAAFAQSNINKGDWMVGGNASFDYQKDGDYKTTTIGLSPNVGYFFINNFAGGLRAGVASSTTKFGSAKETESAFHVSPFVRYYFLPSSQKVNIFADGSFGFGQAKTESMGTEYKYNFTQFAITAGPAIFLTPATALEIGLGFNSSKIEDASDRSNSFGVNVGFQIHLSGAAKK
jgi:hypothetical protein